MNVNAYSTVWGNRFVQRSLTNQQGFDGFAQFKDIDVVHNGIEVEAAWRRPGKLQISGMLSLGDWKYTKDFEAQLFDDNQQPVEGGNGILYTKGAKVGDAAQVTALVSLEKRFGRLNLDLDYRFVDGLYADYSITSNEFLNPNNKGALKLPSYSLVDFGGTYYFGTGWSLRVNINNLFNTTYIAESNSNIHVDDNTVDTWNGIDVRNSVWFGFGTTWNMSLKYRF